jgi:hypothetical protein
MPLTCIGSSPMLLPASHIRYGPAAARHPRSAAGFLVGATKAARATVRRLT